MHGAMSYNGKHCHDYAPSWPAFHPSHDYSQLVISEGTMSCMLNMISESWIGYLRMNQYTFSQMFRSDAVFDSTSLGEYIPLVEEKLGPHAPLEIWIGYDNMKVEFGKYDVDIYMEYTLKIWLYNNAQDDQIWFYDEIHMITSLNLNSDNEILHFEIVEMRIQIDRMRDQRYRPHQENLGITENDYQEFLEDLSLSVSFLKDWMNKVILRGDHIRYPYTVEEMYT